MVNLAAGFKNLGSGLGGMAEMKMRQEKEEADLLREENRMRFQAQESKLQHQRGVDEKKRQEGVTQKARTEERTYQKGLLTEARAYQEGAPIREYKTTKKVTALQLKDKAQALAESVEGFQEMSPQRQKEEFDNYHKQLKAIANTPKGKTLSSEMQVALLKGAQESWDAVDKKTRETYRKKANGNNAKAFTLYLKDQVKGSEEAYGLGAGVLTPTTTSVTERVAKETAVAKEQLKEMVTAAGSRYEAGKLLTQAKTEQSRQLLQGFIDELYPEARSGETGIKSGPLSVLSNPDAYSMDYKTREKLEGRL